MPRTYKPKRATLPAKYEPGFLDKLDGRTELSKMLRANRLAVIDDLGGTDELSHIQRTMIDRYVFLEAYLAQTEIDIATKPKAKADLIGKWIQAVNALTGLARLLGIDRKKGSRVWASHGPQLLDAEDDT